MEEKKLLNDEELEEVSGGSQRIQGRKIYDLKDLRYVSAGTAVSIFKKESICTMNSVAQGTFQSFSDENGGVALGADGNTYTCKASFGDAPIGAYVFGIVY